MGLECSPNGRRRSFLEKIFRDEPATPEYAAFQTLALETHQRFEHGDPDPTWRWIRTVRNLRRLEKRLPEQPREVQIFCESYLPVVEQTLLGELDRIPEPDTRDRRQRSVDVNTAIHRVGDIFKSEDLEVEDTGAEQVHEIPLDVILADREHFRLVPITPEKSPMRILQVRADRKRPFYNFPLPESDTVLHKGGFPRVVLKIIAGAPEQSICAELPPNDYDVIACGDERKVRDEADRMGVDMEGVEMVDALDIPHIFRTRDIDMNNCLMGRNGLVYSQSAWDSVRSGKIANCMAGERGIYGLEFFILEGERVLNGRGISRLVKPVVEGKAESFDFTPLNRQVDMGIYWLVLLRKFAKKKSFPLLAERLYDIGRQIGQVREGEDDVFAVLDRVHETYPFFEFDGAPLDDEGVSDWLHSKLVKYISRRFRMEYKIPGAVTFRRQRGDTIPYEVKLEEPLPRVNRRVFHRKWRQFMERSEERSERFYAKAEHSELLNEDEH